MPTALLRWLSPRDIRAYPASAPRSNRIRFSRWALLLMGFPLLSLLLLPLVALLLRVSPASVGYHLQTLDVRQSMMLSLCCSTLSIIIVILFGTPLAFILVRWRFRGRWLLEALIDLPTVLPPAVAGLALLMAFGRRGLMGPMFQNVGIEIAFTTMAVILAQIFVAASFYIKTASVGLAAINPELEQAAALDGATSLQVFRHITMPLAWRGMLGGAALGWTRALGEFGATILFAGNFPGRTQTMSLLVYLNTEIDMDVALTLAVILLVICFGILLLVRSLLREQDHDCHP